MSERDRMARLAKSTARICGETVALCLNADGTYSVVPVSGLYDGQNIIEYITPY